MQAGEMVTPEISGRSRNNFTTTDYEMRNAAILNRDPVCRDASVSERELQG